MIMRHIHQYSAITEHMVHMNNTSAHNCSPYVSVDACGTAVQVWRF